MDSNHVIETKPGEWVEAYSPVGNVVHFTREATNAKRVCMEYGPSRDWAHEALRCVRDLYRRTEARIVLRGAA